MDLLSAIREGNREALAELVADDVVFHGPASSYRGRDQVVDLLVLTGSIFEDATATREVEGELETVTLVKGQSEGDELEGVLVEIRNGDGGIAEITLILRPLAAVQKAVVRMARALAEGG